MDPKYLIIISGPTAAGKTEIGINLAEKLHTEIVNADSRQVYKEMNIGTAIPSTAELLRVKHHFLSHISINDNYNASKFEQEVVTFLDKWFVHHNYAIMVGGSGMYIDAVCKGIDDLPTIDPDIRRNVHRMFELNGIEGIRFLLKKTDPDYYQNVDLSNPQRIMKALEVFEMTGKPYSSFLTSSRKKRNFVPVKIGLDLPRNVLHERINKRVDLMMSKGLLEEAVSLYPFRGLNALNTVGYKELFGYIEERVTIEKAVENIKSHTRQYARRQLTWFRRDKDIQWFSPDRFEDVLSFVKSVL